MSFFCQKDGRVLQRTGCGKTEVARGDVGGGNWVLARNGCTDPVNCCCVWILLNRRGNQEKSDKQKNGATKTARTGWWLVLAGSPLFTSIAGRIFSKLSLLVLYGPGVACLCILPCHQCKCRVKSMSLGQLGNGLLSPVSGQFFESNNTSVKTPHTF